MAHASFGCLTELADQDDETLSDYESFIMNDKPVGVMELPGTVRVHIEVRNKPADAQPKQQQKQESKRTDVGGEGGGSKKWARHGYSAVLQIPNQLPDHECPYDGQYVSGPTMRASNEAAACLAAKHAFNAMMPRGCRPKHLDCRCSKVR